MAPIAAELATLRAITYRLSSTPTAQLPPHVPAIAASLANCRSLLSSNQASGTKSSSDASVAIHKYRTLLSTLLQDRTIQGRWAAIVLIKATIEVGGWETLQKSLPWVRGLLGMLSKPDPPSSKKLCIITLTRIFFLTREYPTLVREITTPSLPAFIQSCLQMATSKASASLLQVILESFNQLVPRHPTMFRTYIKQLLHLLGQTMAPTPSSKLAHEQTRTPSLDVSTGVSEAARRLYVQLPYCAPKAASSEEWDKAFKNTVANTHRVADKVFRAIVEDWQSSVRGPPTVNGHTLDDEVQDLESDGMSMPPWSGIYAGGERLVNLLRLVKEHLANPTASIVNLHIGVVVDLLTRMLSLTVPSSAGTKNFQNAVRINNQVSKEERENLWLLLPQVHVAAIETLLVLTSRCENSMATLGSLILDQLVWVFNAERDTPQIRTASYLAVAQLLAQSGAALPKPSTDQLSPMIRTCCDDMLPSETTSIEPTQDSAQNKTNGNSQQQTSTNVDAFLSSVGSKDPVANFKGLKQAAFDLLPVLLTGIRAQHLSDSIRARMDRTAILIQHKDAMVASVLNPPPSKKFGKPAASILPLMARSFADHKDIEGLLRPRMPVIRVGTQDSELDNNMDDDMNEDVVADDEALEEEEEEEDVEERFVGHELDSLLETATQTENIGGDSVMAEAPADTGGLARQASSSFAPSISAPRDNDTDALVSEFAQSASGSKRSQTEDILPSLAKRVKANLVEEVEVPFTTLATAATISTTQAFNVTEVVTTSIAPSTLAQSAAAPVTSAEAEADSDADDIVDLVFGQDTDDESDS
jgi:pre-rRNA-processing protein RIX1